MTLEELRKLSILLVMYKSEYVKDDDSGKVIIEDIVEGIEGQIKFLIKHGYGYDY